MQIMKTRKSQLLQVAFFAILVFLCDLGVLGGEWRSLVL